MKFLDINQILGSWTVHSMQEKYVYSNVKPTSIIYWIHSTLSPAIDAARKIQMGKLHEAYIYTEAHTKHIYTEAQYIASC